MQTRTLTGVATGCMLVVASLFSAGTSGAATSAGKKCPNYTQLLGAGGAYTFTNVRVSDASCATALVILEIFPNRTPGLPIEGFSCARHRTGKARSASCVRKKESVAFSYAT